MCVYVRACACNTCSTVVVLHLNSTLERSFGDLFTSSGTISNVAPHDSAKKICGMVWGTTQDVCSNTTSNLLHQMLKMLL